MHIVWIADLEEIEVQIILYSPSIFLSLSLSFLSSLSLSFLSSLSLCVLGWPRSYRHNQIARVCRTAINITAVTFSLSNLLSFSTTAHSICFISCFSNLSPVLNLILSFIHSQFCLLSQQLSQHLIYTFLHQYSLTSNGIRQDYEMKTWICVRGLNKFLWWRK